MKLNGYKIQQALREAEGLRTVLAGQFTENQRYFASAGPAPDLKATMDRYSKTEDRIAALQVVQAQYNTTVTLDNGMTLLHAIKAIGGAGRIEKMWRDSMTTAKPGYFDDTRRTGEEHKLSTIDPEKALSFSKAASRNTAHLRMLIQTGNATQVDIDCDSALFGD